MSQKLSNYSIYRQILALFITVFFFSIPTFASEITTSPQDFQTALLMATPGDVLSLVPGDYGTLTLDHSYGGASRPLTLRSADPTHRAQFSGLIVDGAQGVTLSNLAFDYTFKQGDNPEKLRVFKIYNSKDIIIQGAIFDGDLAQNTRPASDGFGAGQGLVLRQVDNVRIEDSEFRKWHRAMVIGKSTGVVLRGNEFHSIRSDGVDLVEVTNVLIANNYFHDFIRSLSARDHADMIQFWTNGTTNPTVDVTIRGNIFNSGHGLFTQSIFIRNEEVDTGRQGRDMYYRNLTITENVIINAHLHGITVGETDGLIITNNTLIHNRLSDGTGGSVGLWTPTIRVSSASENVSITHNITPRIVGLEKHEKRTGASRWAISDNLLIQDQDPNSPGFYDTVFVAARNGDPATLAPFTYLPNGLAADGTLGASRLQTAKAGAEGVRALIRSAQDGKFINRFSFDAGMSQIAPGAEPIWDFGDGSTDKGRFVIHDFAASGQFRVSLVVGNGGGAAEASVIIDIPSPEILSFDAKTGEVLVQQDGAIAQLTKLPLQPQPGGSKFLSLGQGQEPIKISATAISGLFGARDLTIDLRLRAADTKSPAGEILRVHNRLILTMTAVGGVEFWLNTAKASKPVAIRTGPLRLHDGEWHEIGLRYDGDTGEMSILVDGIERSRGHTAGPIRGGENRGLSLGNPFGKKSFDGQLSILKIRCNSTSFSKP